VKSILFACLLLASAVTFPAQAENAVTISDDVLDAILAAGQWGPNAVEVPEPERLSSDFVKRLIRDYRSVNAQASGTPRHQLSQQQQQVIQNLGLLTLTLSAAKWGVQFPPEENAPPDPANDKWKGPASEAVGKHLMSHSFGGVGLPHLDVGSLARFIEFVRETMPNVGSSADTAVMKQLAERFRGGSTFDMLRNRGGNQWAIFKRWTKAALLEREAQRWILADWVARFWLPSFDAVRDAEGSAGEALVNARIWNSSKGSALCALGAASRAQAANPGGGVNRIQIELDAYARPGACPRSSEHNRSRWPYMRRPVVLLDTLP
jgi:hypothetical protein